MRRLAVLLLVLTCHAGAGADLVAGASAELVAGASGLVVEVVDGDTLVLEDGTQVRLVGIQAPKLPLGRPSFEAWPLADEAKAALEDMALGARVRLSYGGLRTDRHGRALAHLHTGAGQTDDGQTDDGLWLQGELLRRGLARVYSFRDNRALIPEMLALEAEARAARRGIWGHPFYAVRAAEPPDLEIDRFTLVEGLVLAAAIVRKRAYLNFGPDWKSDFTVSIAPRDRLLFEREGIDLEALEGRVVRVRGWVKSWNGPMIEVTHPEQIEVLGE